MMLISIHEVESMSVSGIHPVSLVRLPTKSNVLQVRVSDDK